MDALILDCLPGGNWLSKREKYLPESPDDTWKCILDHRVKVLADFSARLGRRKIPRKAGFAVEGKRFCHRQKTILHSTCASLVRTLRESQNKQYSFRGPFRPGNFSETASLLFSPSLSLSLSLFIVSPSRRHYHSSELFNRSSSMNGGGSR